MNPHVARIALAARVIVERCSPAGARSSLERLLRAEGVAAEIAVGGFTDACGTELPHFWVVVEPPFVVPKEQWLAYARLVDVTATQFVRMAAKRVVILEPGDDRIGWYDLCDVGDHVIDVLPEDNRSLIKSILAREARAIMDGDSADGGVG